MLQSKEDLLKIQQIELANTRDQLNKDFQVLANQILEEKTSRFTDANRLNMEAILKPLNEKLTEKLNFIMVKFTLEISLVSYFVCL